MIPRVAGLSINLATLLALGCCTFTGCEGGLDPALRMDRVDRSWVTGEAAAALNGAGQFVLPALAPEGLTPEISESLTRQLAEVWLRQFAPLRLNGLSQERGQAIRLSEIRLCPRLWYARRAYTEVASEHSLPFRRPYGPYSLASFCGQDGTQVVSLGVSGYDTDIQIVDGEIRFPSLSGGEFKSVGIPATVSQLPLSPERAVGVAYRLTGVRVASVPQLHMPARPRPVADARWRLVIERPITFVSDADAVTYTTDEIWIRSSSGGVGGSIAIAVGDVVPDTVSYQLLDPQTGEPGPVTTMVASPRETRKQWLEVRVRG